jgi:hypothetical protein
MSRSLGGGKEALTMTYKLTDNLTYKPVTAEGDNMETKLTLRMDDAVIQAAKEYASKQHKSLSKLVEDYFENLTRIEHAPAEYSPLVKELSGVIREEELQKLAETDERARYILERKE